MNFSLVSNSNKFMRPLRSCPLPLPFFSLRPLVRPGLLLATLLLSFLGWAATSLSERYQTFSHTGKARKGDTSERIHSGRIDRTPVDYSHIAIPQGVLLKAREVYRECRRQLIGNAADSVRLD